MKRNLFVALLLVASTAWAQNLTDYVDPMIGTGDHGHVFVGANVPFGMVNAGPTQVEQGWDWCSGYHETGKRIVGFGQMHLSGTGCGDLGDVLLMPGYGDQELTREGLSSTYSHEKETAVPGYYSVMLDKFGIQAEVTASCRVGFYRFTFPKGSSNARIVINLKDDVGSDAFETRALPIDECTVAGYRRSRGWANDKKVYFVVRFSQPIHNWLAEGNDAPYGQATFEITPGEKILAKVAISPTSEANALINMNMETGATFDFEAVREAATEAWNAQLGRVKATFRTERERTIFYTAMYHYMVAPQTWCDFTGDYMGADQKVHRGAKYNTLTTWSLWDTYRAAHPLATLIMPDRMRDYAHTMLAIFQEQGELPVWHLGSCETYCMVGEPGASVLADMILKGQTDDVDVEEAYKAIKASLLPTEFATKRNVALRGKDYLSELGYLPYDGREGESVAKSMEYYLACWSAARVAGKLGHKEDSIRFYELSMNYKKLWDKRVNCMRALDMKGEFRPLPENFNPNIQTGDYTEGNPWQYCFLVPHDVQGLVELMGGKNAFIEKLDGLLSASSDLGDDHAPDISGLIGQYAHGNEPSHHVLYMYNYVGQPKKTQKWVRYVMDELYTDKPAGLCGNEDVGQMSAWYILSALGLYQVEPCGGIYQLGSPIVEEAVIPLGEEKEFIIQTHGGDAKKVEVKKFVLNGKKLDRTYITHDEIMAGGKLEVFF